MLPQVKLFLESNDLANATDVKKVCFLGQRLAFLPLFVRVLPLDSDLYPGKDLAGDRIRSDFCIATILLSLIWLIST